MSRRKRREAVEAEMADRLEAERAPVAGLDQTGTSNGWAAIEEPDLDDGEMGSTCRLGLGTHGSFDPDKKRREWFRQLFIAPPYSPWYNQYEAARLFHCFFAGIDGRTAVVGNAFFDLQLMVRPSGYSGPMAAPDELGVGFCATRLSTRWPSVQLVPATRGWLQAKGNELGYADLDAHFDTSAGTRTSPVGSSVPELPASSPVVRTGASP